MRSSDWNDSGYPLAHLLTFRCYGTWLHGDRRGSIDQFNNQYQTPLLPPNEKWHKRNLEILKSEPVRLNSNMRMAVERAVRETCEFRRWGLFAVNVRTNHIHVVAAIGINDSKRALTNLKANATRKLRAGGEWTNPHSPWAKMGSRRFLWNEKSLEVAIDYVINGQGKPIPDFV